MRESFRDKFQMNAVLRITSPQLVVLGALSCINHPCPVTFWYAFLIPGQWPRSSKESRFFLATTFWSRFKIWPVRFGGSILKNKMTNWHLSVCLYVLIYLGLSEMIEGADSSILWMWMNGSLGLVNWCVCIWIQDVRDMNVFNCTLVYIFL